MQENHSFDNYFGTYPGANGIPAGTLLPDLPGGTPKNAPFLQTNPSVYDMSHSWATSILDYDNGAMDRVYVGRMAYGSELLSELLWHYRAATRPKPGQEEYNA